MNEKKIGIYKITNLKNGKVYIGQSTNIEKRWRTHKTDLKCNRHHNIHLQNAWNKYGKESFSFSIIIECPKDDLDSLEKHYINEYDSFKNGYNRDSGGKKGKTISEETRKLISESKTNLTEEEKKERLEKLSLAHEYESIKIIQINLEGKIVKEWKSARYCSKILNIEQSCIYNCLIHKRKTYKGYIWIYKHEYKNFKLEEYLNKTAPKIIIQTNSNNEIINVFKGTLSVKKLLNFDDSCIVKACKQKIKGKIKNRAYGYLWYYLDDYVKVNKNFDIKSYDIVDFSIRKLNVCKY